jgi:hypothetical protein
VRAFIGQLSTMSLAEPDPRTKTFVFLFFGWAGVARLSLGGEFRQVARKIRA